MKTLCRRKDGRRRWGLFTHEHTMRYTSRPQPVLICYALFRCAVTRANLNLVSERTPQGTSNPHPQHLVGRAA